MVPSPAPKHTLFWLVVHGAFGPGESEHGRLADLPGDWQPGSFAAVAGDEFSDLVVMRYSDEAVPGWALRVATKPKKPGDANAADGNTSAQLFETWAAIDALFDDDVVRMDTTFQFETSQPGEGDVCRANTYGSIGMVPDGRYDAPHPAAETIDLWHEVVAGQKNYDPSIFRELLNDLTSGHYETALASLPDYEGLLERLQRLAREAVDDDALLEMARAVVATKSQAIRVAVGADWDNNEKLLDGLRYQIASDEERPDLGDLHYDLSEGFADAASFSTPQPWTRGLAEACFAIDASYDLAYWLTQDWRQTEVDLEPLYRLWQAGGSVAIDLAGVAHVSRADSR